MLRPWQGSQLDAISQVEHVEQFLLSEAHCYSERLWVGGITDCVARMKNGKLAVIDFKSSKDAYYGQFVQVAGYALQLEENGAVNSDGVPLLRGLPKFGVLYVVPFGSGDPTPREHLDVEGRMADFEAAVHLYKSNQMFGA